MKYMDDFEILDADDAVAKLHPQVTTIASAYEATYREDIEQACWFAILKLIGEGCASGMVLLYRARFAACDEYKVLTGHGFRPRRSKKAAPPERVLTSWVGNNAARQADEEWEEPTYLPQGFDTPEFFRELRRHATSTPQRNCLEAAEELIAVNKDDAGVNVTVAWIAARAKTSRHLAKKLLAQVFKSYLEERNRDTDQA